VKRETMVALLAEIKHMARHASLTGSMKKSTRPMVEVYNKCLEALVAEGDAEVSAIFQPLVAESTTVDEVGAYAAMLARYIQPQRSERHLVGEDDED